MVEKRRALGLGLDSLLPVSAPKSGYGDKSVFSCPIERIVPQKGQPRQHFAPRALDELAASIQEHGLLEPLVVRKIGEDKFAFFARNEAKEGSAWLTSLADGQRLIDALSQGVSAVAMGSPIRGRKSVDTYSLAGFNDALAKIHATCHM